MNARNVMLACGFLVAVAPALAADKPRVVNEGGIRDEWMLADGVTLAAPGYPGAFKDRGDSVCVALGYAIKPDGSTSDFSVLKAWNSASGEAEPAAGYWEAFSQAGANALAQWKFKPRPEVSAPRATYTAATLTFVGNDAPDPAVLRGRCAIQDLAAHVKQGNRRDFMKTIDKHTMDSAQRAQEAANQRAAAARAVNTFRPGSSGN